MRKILFALLALAVVTIFPAFAFADDFYLEEYMYTSAPLGQQTMNGTIKTWIKEDKMRKNSFDRDTVIFRADKGIAWMLHEQSKTYVEVPLQQMRYITEKGLEVFSPSVDPMTGKARPWFKKTGRTEKMGKWNCSEIELTSEQVLGPGVTTKTTQWISKDVGVGPALTVRMFKISLGNSVSPSVQKLLDAVMTLDGFPVRQETLTEAQGQKVTSTLTLKTIEKKTLDNSLFEIPPGFTKITPPQGAMK